MDQRSHRLAACFWRSIYLSLAGVLFLWIFMRFELVIAELLCFPSLVRDWKFVKCTSFYSCVNLRRWWKKGGWFRNWKREKNFLRIHSFGIPIWNRESDSCLLFSLSFSSLFCKILMSRDKGRGDERQTRHFSQDWKEASTFAVVRSDLISLCKGIFPLVLSVSLQSNLFPADWLQEQFAIFQGK